MPFVRGQTGVVVPFPDLDPAIERLRERQDPGAAVGVPAHVTVTFPFLAESMLTDDDLSALAGIAAEQPAFEVTFAAPGRFPGVAHLRPEADRPFRELTAALLRRWPQAPPYGGAFGDSPEPHLTIAADSTDDVLDTVERELIGVLPTSLHASGLVLLAFDGDCWHQRAVFPFASAS